MGDKCIIFSHAWSQYEREQINPADICTVAELPDNYSCERLLVACHTVGDDKNPTCLYPVRMLAASIWNGVEHQDTSFKGNVKAAVEQMRTEQREGKGRGTGRQEIGDDWLCVTIDYHN